MNTDSKILLPRNFDPESLMRLRAIFLESSGFSVLLSTVFTFEVVIDANMMVTDVLARRRHQGHPSNNERLVAAGILKLHVPSGAIAEMESRALPKVAKKKKIPISELDAIWREYRTSLTIHEGYDIASRAIIGMTDPDDEIYVTLMQDIGALGVLTQDRHFDFLELRAFNHIVLKDIQSYTIAMTNYLNLHFGGVMGASLAGKGLCDALKALLEQWKRAPIPLQIALLGVFCFVIWNNQKRVKIIDATKAGIKLASPVISGIGSYFDIIEGEAQRAEVLKRQITNGRVVPAGKIN